MANIKFTLILVITFLISLTIANQLVVTKVGSITSQPDTEIPEKIRVPEGHKYKFLLYAFGSQTFICNTTTHEWIFIFPNVTHVNDITQNQRFITKYEVAEHFFLAELLNGGRGIWRSLVPGDDSFVVVTDRAAVPSPDGPDNIDWLLLPVTATGGHGAFADNTYLLRVNTQEGQPPPIHECGTKYRHGDTFRREYQTEYWFFNKG